MSTASRDLSNAMAALDAGRWNEARTRFSAPAAAGDPSAQEGLAQAAWWLDDAEVAVGAREAAYRGYRAVGDERGAVRTAAALGYDTILFGRGVAVGRGWLVLAAELLGSHDDFREAGWLRVREAEVALAVDHDAATASAAARKARAVANATGDTDLDAVGRALTGLTQVRRGRVAEGIRELDGAAVAATAGDVRDLMWLGKICCWLISACEQSHDLDRASEWCARVIEICTRRDLAPLFSVCRTQYASILLSRGRHSEAEEALNDVLRRLQHSRRLGRLDAVALLGELRRRQGRLAEADDLFRQADTLPEAMRGSALVHLARGDAARAWSIVGELLQLLPLEQRLERTDVLAVAVEVAIAAGHADQARAAADELRGIADAVGTAAFVGRADEAEALIARPEASLHLRREAARHFHAAGLVFDEAECRVRLAESLLGADEAREAEEQATTALDLLESFPTARTAERARRILRRHAGTPLTARQEEVLRMLARGLSTADIAAALHLSEHTVHRHIANIYAALGIRSRAAAAVYAAEHGLIDASLADRPASGE